jgi:hypothetical protein
MIERLWVSKVAAACVVTLAVATHVMSQANNGNVPAYPPPSMYGGYGTYQARASTPAQASMDGMANVISSKGSYNLQTSEAAENLTQAQSKEIENRQQATDTYFSMRATNKAATDAERGPAPTMQQITKMAHEGDPAPLGSNEMDRTTGKLNWPSFLQVDMFASERASVDEVFAKKASHGGITYQDRMALDTTLATMRSELKANIRQIPSQDYVACSSFLDSLKFAATKNG